MNKIHPTAIIGPNVILGDGNIIEPYAVLQGNTQIGDSNWIGPHAVIGTPPESRTHHNAEMNLEGLVPGIVKIGSRCIIHEHSAVQSPTADLTLINNNVFLMHGVHIGHDCKIADDVTIAPTSVLAGHVIVGKNVTLGIGTVVHQHLRIGALAMSGMNSTINRNVKPFSLIAGTPARFISHNQVGLERAGIDLTPFLELLEKPWSEWDYSLFPKDILEILAFGE